MSLLDKFKKPFETIGKPGAKKLQSGVVDAKEEKKGIKREGKDEKGQKEITKKKDIKEQADRLNKKKDEKVKKEKIVLRDKSGIAARTIIHPMQTEKSSELMAEGKYVFMVKQNANKNEIKKAVKILYGTLPIKVHTVNMRGKSVQYRRIMSKRTNWKKAIVTLKQGEKIEVFEGV